jgi:NADH dehydrogenase/NADH:ubiquinone oxidoreductase subunit G
MKFTFKIAQSVRSYGTTEVEADNIEGAIAKLTPKTITEKFEPHGHGDDDFDFKNAHDFWINSGRDDDGVEYDDLDIDLPSNLNEDGFTILSEKQVRELAEAVETGTAHNSEVYSMLRKQLADVYKA